ncbi:Sensor histidine kinase YehU [compost metagenome]
MPILHSIEVYSDLTPSYTLQEFVQFMPMEDIKRQIWNEELSNSDYAWLSQRTIQSNNGEISVISFARKVYNRFNRSFAVIVFNVPVPAFQKLIATEDSRSNLALLDSTGKLITYSGDADFYLKNADEIETQLDVQMTGSKRTGDDFVVWASSPDSQWSLVEMTSWKELTAGSLRQSQIFLLLGVLTIIMILVLAVVLSRLFIRPIALLLKAMNNFSLNRRIPLPKDYRNEFGHLFQGYEKLTYRIEELYDSLEQQHEEQRAAEIKALQMMINPHFLYNSLDQINWMAIEASQPQISHMLSHLANFLRGALTNTDSLVTLPEEIAHIESYLEFQKIRWEDGLHYRFDITEEAKELYVPKILLQPFVENAFIHGFHGKQQALLVIAAHVHEEQLEIRITDDGRQLREDWAEKRSAKGGYGLQNVSERIEALFGPHYGFNLKSLPEGGTQAIITLPRLYSPPYKGGNKNVENSHH